MALILCPVLLTFGMFRFTTRQFMAASGTVLAGYSGVVLLLLAFKPATTSLPAEGFRIAVLACVLPCFALAGGKISEMRARLRRSNEELGTALATIRQLATHDTLTGCRIARSSPRASLARSRAPSGTAGPSRCSSWISTASRTSTTRWDTSSATRRSRKRRAGSRRASATATSAARLGGDEFVLLVEEYEGPTVLIEIAERILAAIYQPLALGGHEINLSVSIGICTYPADARDGGTLLSNADIALYQAKEHGRNRFRFYSPRQQRTLRSSGSRSRPASATRSSATSSCCSSSRRSRSPRGASPASRRCVRWQHPELGLLRPDRFIPLAEETGLIAPIGLWVLRTACASARAWREAGMPLPVAVNLSARQFHDGRLVADVAAILAAAGLEAGALELEITESTVMQNPEQAVTLMHEFGRLGVRLAMDDFGIGYSSIGHLKRFPIDSLKLDRTFVRDLPDDPNDVAITRAVIAMAHALSIRVIAEGVEQQAQLELLRSEGCDEFQGYLCQPPLTEAELIRFVRASGAFAASGADQAPPLRVPQRVEDRAAGNVRKLRAGDTVVPFTRGGR